MYRKPQFINETLVKSEVEDVTKTFILPLWLQPTKHHFFVLYDNGHDDEA